MKKLFLFSVIALLAVQVTYATDVVTKDESKLPVPAKTFLNQHFSDAKISYIKIENEFPLGKKYEVVLTNGVEIDFDNKGEWKDIDCKRDEVPAALIPSYASNYVAANFVGEFITKIEKDRHGIEVELNNDLSIKFDNKGNFKRLDD